MSGKSIKGPSGGPKDRYAAGNARDNMAKWMAEVREESGRAEREWSEDRKHAYQGGEGKPEDCHLCDRTLIGHHVKWWNKSKNQMVHTECARNLAEKVERRP